MFLLDLLSLLTRFVNLSCLRGEGVRKVSVFSDGYWLRESRSEETAKVGD